MGDFQIILQTSGDNKLLWKNMVFLDYPDIPVECVNLDCEFGSFGQPREEIAKATGVSDSNIRIKSPFVNGKGVLNKTGTKITIFGITNTLEEWIWLDDEKLEKVKAERDPFDFPSCRHLTPQPGKKGPIYWLSGPPGSGKSTTCYLMAKERGYVYYEADSIANLINPFTDTNIDTDNISIAGFQNPPLKNVPKDIALAVLTTNFFKNDFKDDKLPFLRIMGDHIVQQKKRLGGTFAAAFAVATRTGRDFVRQLVGPDLVFIVMNITAECQADRLKSRHGEGQGGDFLETAFKNFQPAGEDEPRTYNLDIEKGDSKEEVLRKAFEIVNLVEKRN